jgi:hypothetical protein
MGEILPDGSIQGYFANRRIAELEARLSAITNLVEKNAKLRYEIEYKNLYISYLLGQTTKEDFKEQAIKFAEPLDIDKELKDALAAFEKESENEM